MDQTNAAVAARLGSAILKALPGATATIQEWAAANAINRDNFADVTSAAIFAVLGSNGPGNIEAVLEWAEEMRSKTIRDFVVLLAANDPAVLREAGASIMFVLHMVDQSVVALRRLLAAGWHAPQGPALLASDADFAFVSDVFGLAAYLASVAEW